MSLKTLTAFALAAMISVPCLAADEEKGKKRRGRKGQQNAATQLLKQLEEVGLTEEQVAKAKELGKAAAAKMKELRDSAGISNELTKKRAEVMKAMKESGKKGKELAAAINKEAGFSDAQAAALVKVNKLRTEFRAAVVALLSDEQKAKLPQSLQRAAKGGKKGKGKGKKKKDAA